MIDVPLVPGRWPYPVQSGRTVWIVLVALTGVLGVPMLLLFAASAGDFPGGALAVFYGLTPLPFILLAFWWLDRVEPKPRRYKWAALVWGAVVAILVAIVVEGVLSLVAPEAVTATVVAPIVEEGAKCAFLLITLTRWRRVVSGPLEGLIFAGIVAMGFATIEDVLYYAGAYGEAFGRDVPFTGAQAATGLFIFRGVLSPFAHPLFTSAFGLAFGFAATRRDRAVKVLLMIAGYFASVSMHALWNGSIVIDPTQVLWVLVYLLFGVLLLVVAGLAIWMRHQQFVVLKRALDHAALRGWLNPHEVVWLVRFDRKRQARKFAASAAGPVGRDVMWRYQQFANELGFVYHAMMMGRFVPHGVPRCYALVDAMYDLRPWLRMPPPLALDAH